MNKLTALCAIAILTSGSALFGSESGLKPFDAEANTKPYDQLGKTIETARCQDKHDKLLCSIGACLAQLGKQVNENQQRLEQRFNGLEERVQALEDLLNKDLYEVRLDQIGDLL